MNSLKKSINPLVILVALVISIGIVSCKKDDSNNPSVAGTITSGTWRVSYYYDKVKDETSDFAGYVFSFQSSGQLVIAGPLSTTGAWVINNSDDNGGSQKLTISAGASDPLNSLNDDWVITSFSDTKIELKDDSNNNEILHFTKN
jgi:hypothetical protein